MIFQIECNFELHPSKTIIEAVWAVLSLGILTLLKEENLESKIWCPQKQNEKKIVRFLEELKTTTNCFRDFLTFTLFGVLRLQIPRWLHY